MTFSYIILAMAKFAGVPGSLLLAICTHESKLVNVVTSYDNGSPSYGLCQIKQTTAQMLGFKGSPKDLMDPVVNAKYAALYLKYQLNRYDQDLCKAVSAFNMGTYKESKKNPGKPVNMKYSESVTLHLEDKDFLICGPRKVEE